MEKKVRSSGDLRNWHSLQTARKDGKRPGEENVEHSYKSAVSLLVDPEPTIIVIIAANRSAPGVVADQS